MNLKDRTDKFFEQLLRYRYFLPVLIIIFICNTLASMQTNLNIGFDNQYYWWLFSEKLTSGWKVNFAELETWRGYVFPSYCAILNKCARGGHRYFILLNSLINALMFALIVPKLQQHDTCVSKRNAVAAAVNFAIIFLFFSGLFTYTLSDSYALYTCLLGMFFLMKAEHEENNVRLFWDAFCCGLFIYLAYNIRTIYLFSGLVTLILFSINCLKKQNGLARKLCCISFMFLGLIFAAIPQAFLNYKHNGIKSIFVPTQSLMLAQCSWGIRYQRYDTFTGFFVHEEHEQEIPQMYFEDPVGKKMLEKEQVEIFPSWKSFIKFICKHPFEAAGIYTRHFVNMLFPCWPSVYIMKINNNKAFYALFSIALVFSFSLAFIFRCIKDLKSIVYFIPALVSCLFILPGAVESRFFLAVFLLFSSTICFNVDYRKFWASIKSHKISVTFAFVVFSVLMISQWTSCLMSETEIPIFMLGR